MVMMEAAVDWGPRLGSTIVELQERYRSGETTPAEVCRRVLSDIADRGEDGVWISVADPDQVERRCAEIEEIGVTADLPLYGIPFGVKDSIDIEGWPTTLACPAYAYVADRTAPVITRLLDAGGVLIGKTNLDQFATGLNGTRTPYPVPGSVYGQGLISGGSSSGSALAVALGEVPFTVATDTAGSGRVPPALNGVPGYKPSRGLISAVGLVPACRSLDCISLIAVSVADVTTVFDVVAAPDPADPWSRERVSTGCRSSQIVLGLPDRAALSFFGDDSMAAAHDHVRGVVSSSFATRAMDLRPFLSAGELLYQGPWVAERYLEFGDFLQDHVADVVPVVAEIINGGGRFDATDVFRAQYRLAELKAEVGRIFEAVDAIVVPTIGTTFTVEEVLADPIATNTVLGHYTHCGNLLDLCGIALPAGTTDDGRPASCMVLAPALSDDVLLRIAEVLEPVLRGPGQLPS